MNPRGGMKRISPIRTSFRDVQRAPIHSRAWLDALICPLWIDLPKVRAILPVGQDLILSKPPRGPRGKHPIILEVWNVNDGHLEAGGIDSHGWSEFGGATTGIGVGGSAGALMGAGIGGVAGGAGGGILGFWMGPLGWFLGATAGAAAGAATGATVLGASGALFGGRWAAGAARRVSQVGSRVAGSYREIMVTVPCTRRSTHGNTDVAFVLGMYTDSALSRWGERIFGFGYRKKAARVTRSGPTTLEVSTKGSDPLLRVEVRGVSPPRSRRPARSAARQTMASLALPLLGLARSGRAVISFLDRSFSDGSVRLAAASVRVETTAAFLPGFDGVGLEVAPLTSSNPWGAFVATGLPVKLTYPRSVRS
jgi:hypothetical protein